MSGARRYLCLKLAGYPLEGFDLLCLPCCHFHQSFQLGISPTEAASDCGL